jgi:hypothetical protein
VSDLSPEADATVTAIGAAIRARDMEAAAALIGRLAVQDPDAAQRIIDVLQFAARPDDAR